MITDFLGMQWDFDCIGCAIAKNDMKVPGGIVVKTENFYVHQDPETPIEGFMIIASKKHINSISSLTLDENRELSELIYNVRKYLKEIANIDEVTIIQEERSSHLHVWLFPWHKWMDLKFNKSVSIIRDIMSYAKENMNSKYEQEEIIKISNKLKSVLDKNIGNIQD